MARTREAVRPNISGRLKTLSVLMLVMLVVCVAETAPEARSGERCKCSDDSSCGEERSGWLWLWLHLLNSEAVAGSRSRGVTQISSPNSSPVCAGCSEQCDVSQAGHAIDSLHSTSICIFPPSVHQKPTLTCSEIPGIWIPPERKITCESIPLVADGMDRNSATKITKKINSI